MNVYLRPFLKSDCINSFKWKNNDDIWKYTLRNSQKITIEDEEKWYDNTININFIRFSICLIENNLHVGNLYLGNIDYDKKMCEFHIFIGEKNFHGKKIGTNATILGVKYAQEILGMNMICLHVNTENERALKIYKNIGFIEIKRKNINSKEMIYMELNKK